MEGPGKSWNYLLGYDTGGRQNGVGVGADAEICTCAHPSNVSYMDAVIIRCIYMWLVTSVCLYIYMSLVCERVLEKCFWGTGKVLEILGRSGSGNPVSE